jgi:mevalonate kinase
MAKNDDTLSLERLEALKREIDALKAKKTSSAQDKKATPANVMKTMEELSENLGRFMEAFNEATEEMKLEEKEQDFFLEELKPLSLWTKVLELCRHQYLEVL